jgi:hypothetical protein
MSRPARDALEGEGLLGAAIGTSPLNRGKTLNLVTLSLRCQAARPRQLLGQGSPLNVVSNRHQWRSANVA